MGKVILLYLYLMGEKPKQPGQAEKPLFEEMIPLESLKGGVNPANIIRTTRLYIIQVGRNCAGGCLSCGAQNGLEQEVFCSSFEQVTKNLLKEVDDIATGVRFRLLDICGSVVVTGVDTEPLDMPDYPAIAEWINDKSNGATKMAAISHGYRYGKRDEEGEAGSSWGSTPGQKAVMKETVKLLIEDKIPLFVLSLDAVRQKGRPSLDAEYIGGQIDRMEREESSLMRLLKFQGIMEQRVEFDGQSGPSVESKSNWDRRMERIKEEVESSVRKRLVGLKEGEEQRSSLNEGEQTVADYLELKDAFRDEVVEANAKAYAETLFDLMPAIKAGKRVTISLQGIENEKSPGYVGTTLRVFKRMQEVLVDHYGISREGLKEVLERSNIEAPRAYTGGVGNAMRYLGLEERVPCAIIPDKEFDSKRFQNDPLRNSMGLLDVNGNLWIRTYVPGADYNAAAEFPKGWTRVDLDRKVFSDRVIHLPGTFWERMELNATPRVVGLPSEEEEIKLENPCEVYPLSLILDEEVKKNVGETIRLHLKEIEYRKREKKHGPAYRLQKRRRRIVEALIPAKAVTSYANDNGLDVENEKDNRRALARALIKMNTLSFDDSTHSSEISAIRRSGEVLAIQSLLKGYVYDIELPLAKKEKEVAPAFEDDDDDTPIDTVAELDDFVTQEMVRPGLGDADGDTDGDTDPPDADLEKPELVEKDE